MIPGPQRIAIHQAGHAVVQTIVGRQRFAVARVSIDVEPVESWRGLPAQGEALLDRETVLGLYEFGLVTLAGIAAEDHYLAETPPEGEPLVALSDLAAWQERAWDVLKSEARVNLVSRNVMARLHEWMENSALWSIVESLAAALLADGVVEGDSLRQILAPLTEEYERLR
ncbi:MAG: hypothetical protein PHI31_12085 [Desulfuromonadaceae bacterium]|nr:hypothetical protein [Desulfuromonadaceae bacterium]